MSSHAISRPICPICNGALTPSIDRHERVYFWCNGDCRAWFLKVDERGDDAVISRGGEYGGGQQSLAI